MDHLRRGALHARSRESRGVGRKHSVRAEKRAISFFIGDVAKRVGVCGVGGEFTRTLRARGVHGPSADAVATLRVS